MFLLCQKEPSVCLRLSYVPWQILSILERFWRRSRPTIITKFSISRSFLEQFSMYRFKLEISCPSRCKFISVVHLSFMYIFHSILLRSALLCNRDWNVGLRVPHSYWFISASCNHNAELLPPSPNMIKFCQFVVQIHQYFAFTFFCSTICWAITLLAKLLRWMVTSKACFWGAHLYEGLGETFI